MAARTLQGPGWHFVRALAFVRRSELAQRPVVEPEIREAGGSRQKTSQLNLIFPLAELSSKRWDAASLLRAAASPFASLLEAISEKLLRFFSFADSYFSRRKPDRSKEIRYEASC